MELERTSSIVLLSRLVSISIGFIGTVYYARELGPPILGTFFLLQSLVGVLAVPADFGVQGAVEKRLSEGRNKNELFSASFIILLGSFITITTVTYLFSDQINDFLGASLFWELITLLFITIIYQLFISALRGELRIVDSAILEAIQVIVTLGITVGLIFYGLEIQALVYGLLAGKMISSVIAMMSTHLTFRVPKREHFVRIYSFSKYNTILRSSGLIYGWADTIIIGLFLTSTLVGIYEIAWRLSFICIVASSAVSTVIYPNFSKLHSDDDLERVAEVTPKALSYSLVLPIGVFFGAIVLSQEVLTNVYGPAFRPGWLVLIILSGERIIHSFHNIIYNMTLAFDQPDVAFRFSAISIIVNILLNLILVPTIGIEGAAIAMLIAYSINAYLYYRNAQQHVQIDLPVQAITWMVVSGGIMAVVVGGIREFIPIQSVISLSSVIVLGGAIYVMLLLINESFREYASPIG